MNVQNHASDTSLLVLSERNPALVCVLTSVDQFYIDLACLSVSV